VITKEITLEPYKRLKDDVRQALLTTLYNHALESNYTKKNPDGSTDAVLDSRFYKLGMTYDANSHKMLCYIYFKSESFLVGAIPPKSKNKAFNTDMVRLIVMQQGLNGLNNLISIFKIRKIKDRYETVLCFK